MYLHSHIARSVTCAVAFLVATFGCEIGIAQEVPYPLESPDTSSPRGTLNDFLSAMSDVYTLSMVGKSTRTDSEARAAKERAFGCLDLSELPPGVATSLTRESAACLKEVLDRIELPPEDEIPDHDQVIEEGLTKWTIPHTAITIEQVQDGPRAGEFLFNAATVRRAPDDFEIIKGYEYVKRDSITPGLYHIMVSSPGWMIPRSWIPAWAQQRYAGQAIWQWVGLAITLLVSLVLMGALYLLGRRRAQQLHPSLFRYLVTLGFPIVAILIPLFASYLVTDQLQIYGDLVVLVSSTLQVIFLVSLMVLVVSVGNRLAEVIIATPWINPSRMDAQLVRLVCRVLSLIAASVVFLEGGQQLGIPLTTLLAGAGVSGLALALAAQDSLKNVLGSMMILLDKPFRVGERISTKGYDGVVEDIGLRSTKMRLLSGHLVSIPNESMARGEIENIARRPYLKQFATIELSSQTPSAKIRQALAILRGILKDHKGMSEDFPPRVYLRDMNKDSLGIILIFWYHPPNYWEFLEYSEDVFLRMTEAFEQEGIEFSTPAIGIRRGAEQQAD